jgi:hypothetical protein
MPARHSQPLKPEGAPLSIRVHVYSHDLLENKNSSKPVASFRIRASPESTFSDLSKLVLERYRKDGEAGSAEAEVGSILDEGDCAFDFSDQIDFIQPNEAIRFVLAKPPRETPQHSLRTGTPNTIARADVPRASGSVAVKSKAGQSQLHGGYSVARTSSTVSTRVGHLRL